MNTASIFVDTFKGRTTGRKRIFTVVNLTLDVVKTVLKGEMLKLGTEGALEDVEAGYLKRNNCTGFHRGNDGYLPTAKGYRAIFKALS